MSVASTSAASSTLAAYGAEAASARADAADKVADGKDRFLKLLVAQMQNQDPLNPMDNAQVTSQMAQLSTVEGISKLNDNFASMAARLGGANAASLVGRDALVTGSTLALPASGTVRGGIELAGTADKVRVEILDAKGSVVDAVDLGKREAGVQVFEWDGTNSAGTRLPEGSYTMRVAASAYGAPVTASTLSAARVGAVTMGADGGWQLSLPGIGQRAYSDMKGVL